MSASVHVAGDSFWSVQKVWARIKNSPLARGEVGNGPGLATGIDDGGDLGEGLLRILASRGSFDSYDLSQELTKDHQQVVGAIKSLQSLGEVSIDPYLLARVNVCCCS